MEWVIYVPHEDQYPRTISMSNIDDVPRRKTNTLEASISGDGAPRRVTPRDRRSEEEEDIHPCPMPARFMHFFQALIIIAFVLLEVGLFFGVKWLTADTRSRIVINIPLGGLLFLLPLAGIVYCNPKDAKR